MTHRPDTNRGANETICVICKEVKYVSHCNPTSDTDLGRCRKFLLGTVAYIGDIGSLVKGKSLDLVERGPAIRTLSKNYGQ